MRPISKELIERLRRPDPTARVIVEAHVETASDIRQRFDQWGAATAPSHGGTGCATAGTPVTVDTGCTDLERLSAVGCRLLA